MIPRARFDIGTVDLLHAAARCLMPGDRAAHEALIQQRFGPGAIATLSARTAFDLLLRTLALPQGSEVLISAVTIRDMATIVRAHGLVPVPVDLDLQTLQLDPVALEKAWSPRARLLLFAHLFGAVSDLEPALAFARARGLLFVEDVAQSFNPAGYAGHERADVCLFSFGPIKTMTSLGGAVLNVRDPALHERIVRSYAADPVQSLAVYAKRVLKYALLTVVVTPGMFAVFVRACRLLGRSHDEVISTATRGFAGGHLLQRLRHRPTTSVLAVLARRLRSYDSARVTRRGRAGERLKAGLNGSVQTVGRAVSAHTHWIFPLMASEPLRLIRLLNRRGIDATRGTSSLTAIGAAPERPDITAPNAARLIEHILFLPMYSELSERDIERIVRAVNQAGAG